jgi:hypothetical protein
MVISSGAKFVAQSKLGDSAAALKAKKLTEAKAPARTAICKKHWRATTHSGPP